MNKRPFHQKPESRATRQATVGATSSPLTFSVDEVANLLQVSPQQLNQWKETFPIFAAEKSTTPQIRYTHADLATLIVLQKLLAAGQNREEIIQQLTSDPAASPSRNSEEAEVRAKDSQVEKALVEKAPVEKTPIEETSAQGLPKPQEISTIDSDTAASAVQDVSENRPESTPNSTPPAEVAESGNTQQEQTSLELQQHQAASLPDSLTGALLGEMINTVANSQQSMLNVQDSIREMLGVIAQDNFNLKHENRKLRERMLELERTLSEHQRREETRKERLEGRLRAVENTLGAIQQQITQLVQLRRRKERRNWFR